MLEKIENYSAIVTGAGSGIGQAIAWVLAEEGVNVVAADYNFEGATQTSLEASSQNLPGRIIPWKVDVSNPLEAKSLIEFAVAELGGLDILVNNAGVGTPGTVLTTSEADFDRMMSVNVKGTFFCSRYAIEQMQLEKEPRQRSIVNLSSSAALLAVTDRAAYIASKGAILSLTRAMAADHVNLGIRINCICPGTIDTPWVDRMVSFQADPVAARAKMVARQPVGRMGTALEIAYAVLYLASPQASFVTGSALVVDGGLTSFKLPA